MRAHLALAATPPVPPVLTVPATAPVARHLFASSFTAVFAATILATSPAAARELPLWEAGGGFTGLALPDYRGSSQVRGYVFPFPYFNYRGDLFKFERERLRGRIFGSDFVELDFSLNGSPPIKSENNDARTGMRDLDATAEIGPALRLNLYKSRDGRHETTLRLPLRAAVATEFAHVHRIGYTFTPAIGYDVREVSIFGSRGWNVGGFASWLYGSAKYHDYFYTVTSAEAIAGRPAYTAGSGSGGWQATATISKRFDKWWIGGFIRYDTVAGAAFEQSPLVKRTANVYGGFAIAWIFAESKSMVQALE